MRHEDRDHLPEERRATVDGQRYRLELDKATGATVLAPICPKCSSTLRPYVVAFIGRRLGCPAGCS